MDDKALETQIQDKGLTAPRISLADIEVNITDTEIVKHVSKSGQILRWAILTTVSGFAVVGKPSVALSAENDCADIGEALAIEYSTNELWPLMAYELKQRLFEDR